MKMNSREKAIKKLGKVTRELYRPMTKEENEQWNKKWDEAFAQYLKAIREDNKVK